MPPITRTPMIDDDGSGLTGTIIDNPWKTELYNQIDALAAPPYSEGVWTPTDVSGAGLVFTFTTGLGTWVKIGKMVFCSAVITWPSTADTHAVMISLPFPVDVWNWGGLAPYPTLAGTFMSNFVRANSSRVEVFNASNGQAILNSQATTASMYVIAVYKTTTP